MDGTMQKIATAILADLVDSSSSGACMVEDEVLANSYDACWDGGIVPLAYQLVQYSLASTFFTRTTTSPQLLGVTPRPTTTENPCGKVLKRE
jgi:hypothetical protein